MLQTVRTYIDKHKLLTAGKPVIVGLSGGGDSVALITLLCDLGYNCIAAHCNFHLRGGESDRDEAFARMLSDYLDVPFYHTDFDTSGYAREKQISTEMAARELRYRWFEKLRIEHAAQAIAVAHHRQDNVETLLLNLVRGTGIRGLAGMKPKNGCVVRPLLEINKDDITDWLDKKKLNYVTDSTNLSDEYTRNFLRLKVIPLLEELNPSVADSIARTASNLAEVETIYTSAIECMHKDIITEDGRSVLIEPLLRMPSPGTVLYEYLKRYNFNSAVTSDVYQSLAGESGRRFYSVSHELVKDRDRLLIRPLSGVEENQEIILVDENDKEIAIPVKFSLKREPLSDNTYIEKDKNTATLDYDKLQFPLLLRRWEEGDWFIPFGMKGRKKLSDYFTDRKFSLFEKKSMWLLCSGEKIAWIVGERIDNRFCIDKSSKEALIIRFFQ